jgi:hypothetical protein
LTSDIKNGALNAFLLKVYLYEYHSNTFMGNGNSVSPSLKRVEVNAGRQAGGGGIVFPPEEDRSVCGRRIWLMGTFLK